MSEERQETTDRKMRGRRRRSSEYDSGDCDYDRAIQKEDVVFGEDEDEDLYERARKVAPKKKAGHQEDFVSATIASFNTTAEQSQGMISSEMEQFVQSLHIGQGVQKKRDEQVKDEETEEKPKPRTALDSGSIREALVGKGLSGALKLLQERGSLQQTNLDLVGRNTDKKKKMVDDEEPNPSQNSNQFNIQIERVDEFGRTLTPKEAFRRLSHKFHGKSPGKTKQEKRLNQSRLELN